jgi:uracil-DNA glycosylase
MSLDELRRKASGCQACPLWARATQTVFGEGRVPARVMLVGEQPGDEEDKQGLPFVGPAGRLLDRALAEAGVDRRLVYVTNAVKHFKWEPRGKRRIHKTPAQQELDACFQWLEGEIVGVRPRLIICLGATAAKVLLGSTVRVTQIRGMVQRRPGLPDVVATFHPSYLLRLKGEGEYATAYAHFLDDLRIAVPYLLQ